VGRGNRDGISMGLDEEGGGGGGMGEQYRLAWDRESTGGWRDPRKGKEGQENGRGSGRLGKRQREGGIR
jgi:hypothetical protein